MLKKQHFFINWSKTFTCTPQTIAKPSTISEIRSILYDAQQNKQTIRAIGSGHSFSELVKTDDILLSLENFHGIEEINTFEHWAVVKGGTTLQNLTRLLAKKGFALPILGDIDKQTLAGALSTGTHGSSLRLGNISSFILELTVLNAEGALETINSTLNPELFSALQLSLGCLGIILYVKISISSLYYLRVEKNIQSLSECICTFEAQMRNNQYFEFFFPPGADIVYVKKMNVTEHITEKPKIIAAFVQDIFLENCVLWFLCETSIYFPGIKKLALKHPYKFLRKETRISSAECAFATSRMVRFKEMEYAIPIEHAKEVLEHLFKYINSSQIKKLIPIEVRFGHSDNIALSPAYQQDVIYIAVHAYYKEPYLDYFQECETLFKHYKGRPHWGKIHTTTPQEFNIMYPKWNQFLSIRKKQDPENRFLNQYLRQLFLE